MITTADFVNRNGNCKPTNFETLAKFKALQTQLNRVAEVKRLPKIAVDGDLGPGTLALLASVTGGNGSAVSSCSAIAPVVEALTAQVMAIANANGAPAKVSSPAPAVAPSIINPGTGAITPQPVTTSLLDVFGRMSSTQMMLLGGMGLGIGYFILKGKKRGKRR